MKALLVALALLIIAFPVGAATTRVEVNRNGERWTADYNFPYRAPAWVFPRSAITEAGRRPWRPSSWTVETPGLRIERRGRYDILVAADGGAVPRSVRIGFRPFPGRVVADYDPAIVMTDGSVALYSEQFAAFPVSSAAEAGRLPAILDQDRLAEHLMRVTYRDKAGPLLHSGRRQRSVTLDGTEGSYVLFGPAQPISSEMLTMIVDPQLPSWLGATLVRATPRILALYARDLGPAPGRKPTIIVGWAGPGGHISMGGGTLPGLIVMRFEGAGLIEPNADAARTNLWFIAHESAHFWLGEAIGYATPRDAWITEGGADLLAIRAISAVDPGYDPRRQLQSAIDDCAGLSLGRGIASALERNEHRAYYACGALFGLVAEGVTGKPFASFVRELIDASRADRVVTRSEWLAALAAAGADRRIIADIIRLLDPGSPDPKAVIASLLTRSRISFTLAANGIPTLS